MKAPALEHLARAAADALNWDGTVLQPSVLLGRRVAIVATLISEVHERRSDCPPVTDRMSVAMWDWPEMRHLVPAPAVRLSGVIAPARHWPIGLIAVAPFVRMCPTALLLPAPVARDAECLTSADHYGHTVLSAAGPHDDPDAVDVVHLGRPCPGTHLTATARWVHELVYDHLLRLSPDWMPHDDVDALLCRAADMLAFGERVPTGQGPEL